MSDEAVIRVRPLDGQWETLGSERLRGILPKGIEASSDSWGPSVMNFLLDAEPGMRRPDLLPFTPVDLEVGGQLVWAGFVWQRPTDANGYSVGCRGWQYHLDDDLLDRVYVYTRLQDYVDQRSFLAEDLTIATQAWQVQNGEGGINLSLPAGVTAAAGRICAAAIDLGPDSTAKRVVVTLKGGGKTNLQIQLRAGDLPQVGGDDGYVLAATAPTGSTTYAQTLSTVRRYIRIMLTNNTGGTLAGDETSWVQIRAIQVFRDTAYESGNASILKADAVVKDVLAFAPLLDQSTSLITPGTFSLPECLSRGYLTPRQFIELVNSYENFRMKIGGESLRTVVFDTKPTAPLFEVGDWSGADFSDASASGEEILDKVVIDATGPDGARLVSQRSQLGTQVDRRNFHRSRVGQISSAVTSAVADRLGDLYLAEHKTAPFSGQLTLTGDSARRVVGGKSVPAAEFLRFSGEKVRIGNRIDPDTGAAGRDGRIAGTTYKHDSKQATITIDDRLFTFEQTLARYGLLTGQT